ncbi:MAG: FecR family protein [Pseudomonadota bacterium]
MTRISYHMRLEEAGQWLSEIDRGALAAPRRAQFQQWIADAANRRAFDEVLCLWNDYEALAGLLRQDFPGIPSSLKACVESRGDARAARRASWGWRPRLAIATGFAAVAMLMVGYFAVPRQPDLVAYSTAKGEYREVTLSDGSSVRLNTATALAVAFSPAQRRVALKAGEAFFTVAKDAARPFIVETDGGTIRAVGTAFNVRTSAHEVEVTVVEGKIEITPSQQDAEVATDGGKRAENIALMGGQSVTYGHALGQVENIPPQQIAQRTAWQSGRVYFNAMPLKDIVAELNRYSAREIVIADAGLETITGGGVFYVRDVDAFLDGLELALPLKVVRTPSSVIVLLAAPPPQ